jgi:hypothetical protein
MLYRLSHRLLMLGDWVNNVESISHDFQNARPFEHVLIQNFLAEPAAQQLIAEFPAPLSLNGLDFEWKHYDNPIEQKYALNDFSMLPFTTEVINHLNDQSVIRILNTITGFSNLEADHLLHGAGLHAYPSNGKLDIHLDYDLHPLLNKERRVNLILYLNPEWQESWGGNLELWDEKLQEKKSIIIPSWNTAAIFKTCDISFHGIPKPITSPQGVFRKSLALYYISEPRPAMHNTQPRYKAEFFPCPGQPVDDRLAALYNIRKTRILSKEDMASWSSWRQDGQGHW